MQALDLELRLQEQTLLSEKSAMQVTSQTERLQAALAAEVSASRERDQALAELCTLGKETAEIRADHEHLQAALERCEIERATLHTQAWRFFMTTWPATHYSQSFTEGGRAVCYRLVLEPYPNVKCCHRTPTIQRQVCSY
jgi:hypothetical protein